MKLKHRLYLMLLGVSLIPLFACSIFILYQNDRNVENVVTQDLIVTCDYQIDNVERFCEQIRSNMQVIAQYNFVQEELLISLGEEERVDESGHVHLEDLLKERQNYYPYLESMAIIDATFHVVAASEEYMPGGESELAGVNKKVLTGEFYMGNIYERMVHGENEEMLLACQGVYDGNRLIGYVVEEILVEYFDQYHKETALWEYGVMQILDGNGNILTVGGVGEGTPGFFNEQQRHDFKVEMQRKEEGFKTSGAFSYELDNKRFVTCYSELPYSDWMIRVTVNVDGYARQGVSFLVLFFTVLAISALLLVAVNYFVTERMTAPIEETCELLKRVQEEEDYSLRINIVRADEMGDLQCEINHLLGCVAASRRNERKEQEELTRKTEQDPMTGVYNKRAIGDVIEQKADEIAKRYGKIAVGFVDIDDFKDYNTMYGHLEGDHVIKFVANTLRGVIHGVVGRYGGDEFVFCMEAQDKEMVEQTLKLLACKLEQGVINGVTGERMPIPCSIGVVFETAGNTEGRQLIHDADGAMYVAKEKGKNTYYMENR